MQDLAVCSRAEARDLDEHALVNRRFAARGDVVRARAVNMLIGDYRNKALGAG
jgi:hypothetical protein